MGLQDFIATPIYLGIFYILAIVGRPYFTDNVTRKYFLPALSLKFFGAIAVGLIYEFYYGYGGDTFNYYHNPGTILANSFWESPILWLKLLFSNGQYDPLTFDVATKIFTYSDQPTFFVARFVGLFGVFTANSYYSNALFFALFSFSGVWALFHGFYKLYPPLHRQFAIACLFLPSLWFWGSGILKDTITFGAIGWLIFSLFEIVLHKKYSLHNFFILVASSYVIMSIKIYIILCLVPAVIYWVIFHYSKKFKNQVIRILLFPFLVSVTLIGGYSAVKKIGEDDPRYSLETIAYTAESTARWLAYVGESSQGSVYTLGDYDFSPSGVFRKAPLAIWTTLFRPHLWEAGNPVMFMSALESFFLLMVLVMLIVRIGIIKVFKVAVNNPLVTFLLIYSIIFAFAVGFSTYNFGSLVRYRIPLIPFFLSGLFIIQYISRKRILR